MVVFIFFFFIACSGQLLASSSPELDCSKNQNEAWCRNFIRGGIDAFCSKGSISMSVCRRDWCEKCPKEKEAELLRLRQSSLWERAKNDARWPKMKKQFGPDFEPLGLGNYFVPPLEKGQLPRYAAYLKALDEIEEILANPDEPYLFELAINKFAFMTDQERYGVSGTVIPADLKSGASKSGNRRHKRSLLPSDWTNKIKINGGTDWRAVLESTNDIKDQGFCGCCWALSASQALESLYEIRTHGKRMHFSYQDLIDCSSNGINNGCGGGLAHFAFEYIRDHGLVNSTLYPYDSFQEKNGGKKSCRHDKTNIKSFLYGFDYYYNGQQRVNNDFDATDSETRLMKMLDIMPVAGTVASNRLYFYKNGIFNTRKCTGPLNHAVLIVGYGTADDGTPYWIIKNSWGKDWGENGYIRIKRGNYCGVAQYWAFPKKIQLCTKLPKSVCGTHPNCHWYGDMCDHKELECVSFDNAALCKFYGCFWQSETNKCFKPTAKCVCDNSLQQSEKTCNKKFHCEWNKLGNCQVKKDACNGIELSDCKNNFCIQTDTCTPWPAYQCATMFKTQMDCNGKSYCQWYSNADPIGENFCLPKVDLCTSNTKLGESECNKIGCQWVDSAKICGPPTQSCLVNDKVKANEKSCIESGLCSWKKKYGICNIKADVCTTVGVDQNKCVELGCFWKISDNTCIPTEVSGSGECATFTTQPDCESVSTCTWLDGICATGFTTCTTILDSKECNNMGCSWYGLFCTMEISLCSKLSLTACSLLPGFCYKSDRLQKPGELHCDLAANRCQYDIAIYNSAVPSAKCMTAALPFVCSWDGKMCRTADTFCGYMPTQYFCNVLGCVWNLSENRCAGRTTYPCSLIQDKDYCGAVEYACVWNVGNNVCEQR